MSDKRFPANIISSTPVEPSGSFEDSSASGTWSLQEAFSYVKAGLWPTAGNQKPLIEDVFSTYLWTGTSVARDIVNGIDLAGEGGLTWIKWRSGVNLVGNLLFTTDLGAGNFLTSNAGSVLNTGNTTQLNAFNSDGFSLGNSTEVNYSGDNYASWTFRKAPRFFDCVEYTGTGVAQNINHSLGVVPGCIIIKSTSNTENWQVWHRSVTGNLELDSTAAVDAASVRLENVTDTSFGVKTFNTSNGSGQTYVAYLFAHDPLGPSEDGSDGLIACGSYTGDGTIDGSKLVNVGWEPQWLLIRNTSVSENWLIIDNMRGASYDNTTTLFANLSQGDATSGREIWTMDPQGFRLSKDNSDSNQSGNTYIYIAIRRGPMRAPTSGTEVFLPTTQGLVDNDDPGFKTDWPVDFAIRTDTDGANNLTGSRLTGIGKMYTDDAGAENTTDPDMVWDFNNGWWGESTTDSTKIAWLFRRAPAFFDAVAYSGTGTVNRVVNHNLTVAPELAIFKRRDDGGWIVKTSFDMDESGIATRNNYLFLNSSNAYSVSADYRMSATETDITLSTNGGFDNGSLWNASGANVIAYLFATLPGVSKVGSYTGNGTSQTIDCGFTSGARFILIKRTDSTGDWYVWDSARGIVAGNDPHLSLNTADAEVTTDDSVDAESSGFIVNQDAGTNVNVNTASYIFLAIA
jgi:hypothetical protein